MPLHPASKASDGSGERTREELADNRRVRSFCQRPRGCELIDSVAQPSHGATKARSRVLAAAFLRIVALTSEVMPVPLSKRLPFHRVWVLGVIVFIVSVLLASSGCTNAADGPREIVMNSLLATPDTLGPGDSTIVECTAHSLSGLALVYDWVTDARLRIAGAPPNQDYLYTTKSNRHVFYIGANYSSPIDTAWVQCFARDLQGGSAARQVNILLHH